MSPEKALNTWKKARYDFQRKVIQICGAGPSILFNKQSADYRNFIDFCQKKLILFPQSQPAEVYTFLVFVRFSSLTDAKKQYLEWTGRSVLDHVLQTKARRVRNKVIDYLKSESSLLDELRGVLTNEDI